MSYCYQVWAGLDGMTGMLGFSLSSVVDVNYYHYRFVVHGHGVFLFLIY